MDTTRIRELLKQRDELDEEIREAVGGTKERKPQKCSHCQQEGHTARNCPTKQ